MYIVALPLDKIGYGPVILCFVMFVFCFFLLMTCEAGSEFSGVLTVLTIIVLCFTIFMGATTKKENSKIADTNERVQWFNNFELMVASEDEKRVPNGAYFEYVMGEFVDGKYIVTFQGTDKTDEGNFFVDGYIRVEVPERLSDFNYKDFKFKALSNNREYVDEMLKDKYQNDETEITGGRIDT